MSKRYAVILAAGQGTRMKSKLYKVLHPVAGRPMVQHVIHQLKEISLEDIITIVGHGAEQVIAEIEDDSEFIVQGEQLGTGHAVQQAESLLQDQEGTTIVVYGDTPLLTSTTLQKLFDQHEKTGAKATVLTTRAPDPTGYGRVIRNDQGEVEKIVEQKDATERELLIDEINVGTYCFDNQALFAALKEVSNDNAQGEYYLTDVIGILKRQGQLISAYKTPDFEETIGINDRVALAEAEKIMQKRINHKHMLNGVTIMDPEQTYIGPDVEIAQDVVIYPGSILSGTTTIEEDATIGPHTKITDSLIEKSAIVRQSTVLQSTVGVKTDVGPYAFIRPDSVLGAEVRVGPYVEIKKAQIGDESKVSHLTYIGDAEVGKNVNVGCGTITVNYDGKEKHVTQIGDDSFIGCNSNLVAPVTIGEGSYVAAGSTITRDVPEESLSIARARQTNKEGYASRLRNRKKK